MRMRLGCLVFALALLVVACGPTYPNCENDEHCQEQQEVCVDKICRECGTNDDCMALTNDKCMVCSVGFVCEKKPGCCHTAQDCPDGGACIVDRCVAKVKVPGALGPAETVQFLIHQLAGQKLSRIVGLLPSKYFADLDAIVHEFARNMDADLWNKYVSVMDRFIGVTRTRSRLMAELIVPMGLPVEAGTVQEAFAMLGEIWAILKDLGLTDLDQLKTLSTAKLAQAALPLVLDKMWVVVYQIQRSQIHGFLAMLATAQVSIKSTSSNPRWGEVAEVEIAIAGDAETAEFVKVDGRWIPLEMAEEWDQTMKEARIDAAQEATAQGEKKPQLIEMLTHLETALDEVEESGSLEALKKFMAENMGNSF